MSYTIQVVDMQGKEVKKHDLPTNIFAEEKVNQGLIHEYVVMYLANQRQSTAHTKTRGEIRGSGRKLYAQKGSGKARVGDAASPIRRKGGTVFGPRNERNWSKAMPKKMKVKALTSAVSLKAQADKIMGLDAYTVEKMKTKEAVATLKSIGLDGVKTLLVTAGKDESVIRTFNNIPTVKMTTVNQLNAYDVMSTKQILFVGEALAQFISRVSA